MEDLHKPVKIRKGGGRQDILELAVGGGLSQASEDKEGGRGGEEDRLVPAWNRRTFIPHTQTSELSELRWSTFIPHTQASEDEEGGRKT